MATTYEIIASVTVGSGGAASMGFTSIPATYTDLVVKISSRTNHSGYADGLDLTFNSNASSYTYRLLDGDGASASSSTGSAKVFGRTNASTSTASTFGNSEVYVPNYASSNNKSFSANSVGENNATSADIRLAGNLWANSAAITSISITPQVGISFNQYSTAYLYGISNA